MSHAVAAAAPARWALPVQLLHWLGVLLLLSVATLGLLMVDMPRGSELRKLCYGLHKSLGIAVLGVALLRLLARALVRAPAALPGPAWQLRVARLAHGLMYALLLAVPLSGWLLNSVAGQPLPWFGLVDLPPLADRNPAWRKPADTAHLWLFWTLAALVAVHVLAALHHHWIARDATLRRMLPGRRG
ncbi:cytochrome b [Pseudoxanthomonas broegbernensis]|uniref:Cytochrome b n=1 Tax=Pseudoxanthomonas broegbernensis TaxID=83619 RepID=A0A7V8GKK8_9GAMM|nr:cytochrome b [Pseudoxanthomonas broegbernensis]KAF1685111.1 cytochrome b [Pseudoxanthomonas broegbernensis]MBB6066226.1 cytochrome b561 [Pseudoxanthomonas broegbernensis]